ncbi:MAG: helix-turn-helix domain-containing protein, partial [Glutamicibacter sp.]
VLSAMGSDPKLRTFALAELSGLLNPLDLAALDLLDLYLAHGGNKTALAKAGYLSRPTLYSRLAKLEAKLGVQLDSAESRASLQVALLWYRMHG